MTLTAEQLSNARLFHRMGLTIADALEAEVITEQEAYRSTVVQATALQHRAFVEGKVKVLCPPGPGCRACCCELTESGIIEARVARRYLHQESKFKLRSIIALLRSWLPKLKAMRERGPMEPLAYMCEDLACPFLKPSPSFACAIYPARPVACRLYVSTVGAAECHAALEAREPQRIQRPVVLEALVFALSAIGGAESYIFAEAVAAELGLLDYELKPVRHCGTVADVLAALTTEDR